MSKLNLLLLIILSLVNCTQKTNDSNKFIEFVHTGIQTKINRIFWIGTQKMTIKLNDQQLTELKGMLGDSATLTEQKKEEYIKIRYNRITTDNKTLTAIQEFVFTHKEFYTNSEHLNNDPATESYNIIVNGPRKFSIYYSLKSQFFKELLNYLKEEKCDQNIIKEISYL
ncbi:hypothetical protein G7092_06725 [Mucilaginibacter sp. HC2]|uniref:hypothetical protein n=1 Tax=Mucilaginibacter inviolabilis TaxID=2714892 RepID=UPI00140899BB|nr:hypothetical protein [Mucilaginibacter inviolabilis]NHA03478.1 hypothetical protein [Mucilaginibacter inviolabilis]